VFADPSGVRAVGVADVQVPTEPNGDIWLYFARVRSTQSRNVSARDVLEGHVDADRFRNKLVLVGLTGTGLTDMRATALGEVVPGIEIQAQAIETIFEGRLLRRPAWLMGAERAFIMAFGLLIIWYVPHADSRLAAFVRTVPKVVFAIVGISLNLLLLLICFLLFKYFGLLVDAASIFIILSAVVGSFFSAALVDYEAQSRRDTTSAAAREGQEGRKGKSPG